MSKSTKRDAIAIRDYRAIHQHCEVCHAQVPHIHHIKTRGSGGTDESSNLIALCPECHTEVHRIGNFYFAIKYGLEERFKHVLKGIKP